MSNFSYQSKTVIFESRLFPTLENSGFHCMEKSGKNNIKKINVFAKCSLAAMSIYCRVGPHKPTRKLCISYIDLL